MRKNNMAAVLVAVASLFSSLASHAADGFIKATVEYVRVHDRTWAGGAWSPPVFTRESFLTVLSAQMTGKEIAIYYNDTLQALGYCKAGYITVGDPPPLQ
jgi:hypothetical protein